MELKSYAELSKYELAASLSQFKANKRIVETFLTRTNYDPLKVNYKLFIYERNIQLHAYTIDNDEPVIYGKGKEGIIKYLESIITSELNVKI